MSLGLVLIENLFSRLLINLRYIYIYILLFCLLFFIIGNRNRQRIEIIRLEHKALKMCWNLAIEEQRSSFSLLLRVSIDTLFIDIGPFNLRT